MFVPPSIVLLIVSTYAITDGDWDHVITVDGVNGTHNDTMCINGSLPCATLNMALKGIKDNHWYNVCIEIRQGNYILEYGEENELIVPHDVYANDSSMAIIGINKTVINCEPSAGLYIEFFDRLHIDSISFHNCGYYEHDDDSDSVQAAITIYGGMKWTTINNVDIYNSNGSGILFYHPYNISITNSLITGGTTGGIYSEIGGGIVLLVWNPPVVLIISHSNITNNDYSGNDVGAAVVVQTHVTDPNSYNGNITIDSCFILDNNRGLYYAYEFCKYVQCRYVHWNGIVHITNTQMSSLNSSLIEMQNNPVQLHLYFTDVNITDSFIVSIIVENTYFPCDALPVVNSCSDKHKTCQFPEFDVRYSLSNTEKKDNIIGPGKCSNNCILEYHKGHHCPVSYSVKSSNGKYSCWDNYQGELCGQCIEGHSVAINSPYLACVPCNDTMTVLKGWGLLIVLEFIPVTVMVAVIAVLNVNLNQGSLKAYIFFCQIFTIPFPSVSYPSWFVIAHNYENRIVNIPLVVLAIWNLGFISYPSFNIDNDFSICIFQNTTALGAIFFWYLIAFYPFILLFLVYLCVLAYDRGFHYVVCVKRPVHRLLARFWCKFNIQPSLPHTIASVYTLCFTQLAATSLKLLHFTTYDNQLRFFYDGSQKYFFHWHGAAGTLALIVLIVFIIVPVVYLSVYPFMWFQKCLNKVKIRKDLLISVTDVFTAPYSDGTQYKRDYRYYASSHFILQLLVMVLYYIPSPDYSRVILGLQVCLCSIFLVSIVVFQPYKRKSHVFTEAILILALIGSSFTMLYILHGSALNHFEKKIFKYVIPGVYSICGLFFLISCSFCCVWFIRKFNKRRQRVTRKQLREVSALLAEDDDDPTNDQSEDEALLADRLVNPDIYNKRSSWY